MTTKRHEQTFEGDGNILYLDSGNRFTSICYKKFMNRNLNEIQSGDQKGLSHTLKTKPTGKEKTSCLA